MEVIGRQILLYYFVVVAVDYCENAVEIIFVGGLTQYPINVTFDCFYQETVQRLCTYKWFN